MTNAMTLFKSFCSSFYRAHAQLLSQALSNSLSLLSILYLETLYGINIS